MVATEAVERILLVEDEEDVALVLKTRLEAVGYDVHTETFGSTAVSYAVEHQPDLVILDIRLPDLGGYEVCQELRRFYGRGHLPILMFTVLEGLNDDIRGFASGADAYLNKRCAPNRLLATVNQLLRADA